MKYNELAQYAAGLVPNEYVKIKRFVQRLDEPLYTALAGQVGNFKTLSQAADCARGIEYRKKYARPVSAKRNSSATNENQGGWRKKGKTTSRNPAVPALMGPPTPSNRSYTTTSGTGTKPPPQTSH